NVLVAVCSVSLLFGALIYFLLAYTPLNYIFPTKSAKYSSQEQYKMMLKIDSLETSLYQLKLQSDVLGKVLAGEEVDIDLSEMQETDETEEVQQEVTENPEPEVAIRQAEATPQDYSFYIPLNGVITDTFNLDRKHLAIDISAKSKSVIKSIQKGTVIFSSWTPGGGHTMLIQHPNEFISVYKHNAVLLKKEGSFVKAGDAVALVGNTGELSSGPHLHFELWKKGLAVNPQQYINF
ncbi:MAG: M23 family metallopeptidase, partial [Bacteroidia bacterium]